MVFDNAQEPENVQPYLPVSKMGHVLITSRNQHWSEIARPLEVQVFDPNEATDVPAGADRVGRCRSGR